MTLGLILSIPVGILADRWGRKPIIALGVCAFPLRLGWQLFICKLNSLVSNNGLLPSSGFLKNHSLIHDQVGFGKASIFESLGSRHYMLLLVEARQSCPLYSSSSYQT